MARVLALLLGAALVLAGVGGFLNWHFFAGFPDGYISPYEREMTGFHLAGWLADVLLGLLVMACGSELLRLSKGTAAALALALVFFALTNLAQDQLYHLMTGQPPNPDKGQGG